MQKLRYLIISLILSLQAYSLQIEDVYFGFNNSVHSNSFNFISFTIHNDTAKPYEGTLKLKGSGLGVKTVSTKELFLTPNQKKSVQMYFYIQEAQHSLILEYGEKKDEINTPKSYDPAHIFISSRKIRLPKNIKYFPETNFPFSVAYTSSLFSVVIDSVPDWTPKQRNAFMNWLKLGGNVFVLKSQSGKFPQFTSNMAELNRNEKQFSIGSGLVKKVDSLLEVKLPIPLKEKDSNYDYYMDNEENVFANLQLLVKTDHNWAFIYFLIIVYLILIGPVNYIIGRKTRDWKLPNLFFLLTVVLFSIFFSVIGRRGYGEETKLNSFTLADHISDNNFLVKQWSNIFVTSGNTYSFTHDTEDNLYASPSNFEMATKIDQSNASFIAEIPLFSSKRMIHMGTGKGQNFKMLELKKNGSNIKLKVESSANIKKAWFVMNGTVYKAKNQNGYFSVSDPINFDHYHNSDAENAYLIIEKIVLKQATKNTGKVLNPRVDPYQNSDAIHFYALTETPDSFHSIGEISDNETGWTLNRFKLNLNEAL